MLRLTGRPQRNVSGETVWLRPAERTYVITARIRHPSALLLTLAILLPYIWQSGHWEWFRSIMRALSFLKQCPAIGIRPPRNYKQIISTITYATQFSKPETLMRPYYLRYSISELLFRATLVGVGCSWKRVRVIEVTRIVTPSQNIISSGQLTWV